MNLRNGPRPVLVIHVNDDLVYERIHICITGPQCVNISHNSNSTGFNLIGCPLFHMGPLFADYEIRDYENFTRITSTEGKDQRKHREDQTEQNPALLSVQRY